MNRFLKKRSAAMALALSAGLGAAALVGVAVAKTFTLHEVKNATVMNANTGAIVHENIVTNSRGFAAYTLTGDSMSHPQCISNQCRMIWPWLTVSSPSKLSKGPGVPGKLTVWHHNGVFQVVDGGHPVYRFAFDKNASDATGEAIHSFGGTWHVLKGDPSGGSTSSTSSTMSSTMTSTSTSTPTTPTTPTIPYPYP